MAIESDGHSRGNPRLYEVIEGAPKEGTGKSPVIWDWPLIVGYLKIAAQPVQGPWPPHQEPRPDPSAESLPTAVPDDAPPASDEEPPPAANAEEPPPAGRRRVSLRDNRRY